MGNVCQCQKRSRSAMMSKRGYASWKNNLNQSNSKSMYILKFASRFKRKFVEVLITRPCNLAAWHQQGKIVLILLRKRVRMYPRNTATRSLTRLRKWSVTAVMGVMTWLKMAMRLLMQVTNVKGNHILPHFLASKTVVNVIKPSESNRCCKEKYCSRQLN